MIEQCDFIALLQLFKFARLCSLPMSKQGHKSNDQTRIKSKVSNTYSLSVNSCAKSPTILKIYI